MKTLGIVGGMGTYASLSFIERFLVTWREAYFIRKEWEYPHFILDNQCQLPSRVRHILYDEESPLLGIEESVKNLRMCGADVVVMPCITAHFFMPIKGVVDMVELLKKEKIDNPLYIATEGTEKANVLKGEYAKGDVRSLIEDVKAGDFRDFEGLKAMMDIGRHNVVACTELSAIYHANRVEFTRYEVTDVVDVLFKYLLKEIHGR